MPPRNVTAIGWHLFSYDTACKQSEHYHQNSNILTAFATSNIQKRRFDKLIINNVLVVITPTPHRVGHNALMAVFSLSVPCLTLSREWKGIAS